MEPATDLDITLFEAFLTDTDPGTNRLLAELLGIPVEAISDSDAEPAAPWNGVDRRRVA